MSGFVVMKYAEADWTHRDWKVERPSSRAVQQARVLVLTTVTRKSQVSRDVTPRRKSHKTSNLDEHLADDTALHANKNITFGDADTIILG